MKDIDKLKNLLTEFGIGFKIDDGGFDTAVVIKHGATNVIGHKGCTAEFYFDKDGVFIQAGAWK